jgi:hypothetical protein
MSGRPNRTSPRSSHDRSLPAQPAHANCGRLVGRHDDQDPVLNVYAELYRLLGAEPPDSAGRDKPPCCDADTDLPPVLGAAVDEFVERASKGPFLPRAAGWEPASTPC